MAPVLLLLTLGVIIGLLASIASFRRQFQLRQLFVFVALVGCLIGVVRLMVQEAYYAAARSSYGGRRSTREEAEAIRGDDVKLLPDSEFRESK
jgi:hypothetical protein